MHLTNDQQRLLYCFERARASRYMEWRYQMTAQKILETVPREIERRRSVDAVFTDIEILTEMGLLTPAHSPRAWSSHRLSRDGKAIVDRWRKDRFK